jgi:hypothetical protein
MLFRKEFFYFLKFFMAGNCNNLQSILADLNTTVDASIKIFVLKEMKQHEILLKLKVKD